MKGTLHKTEQGWIVIYDEVIGENIVKKNQNSLPILDHGYVNGPGLSDSDKGQEVEFNIFDNREICNCACHRNADITHFVACCNDGYSTDNLGHVNYCAKLVDKATRPLTENDAYPTRLVQLKEQAWDVIWKEFRDNKNASYAWSLFEHLRDNYNPPIKKQTNE
jgi:hypothetical protein